VLVGSLRTALFGAPSGSGRSRLTALRNRSPEPLSTTTRTVIVIPELLQGDWKLGVELPKPLDATIRPHHAHGCSRAAAFDPERFKFLLHGLFPFCLLLCE
jgi:hypothetical protein